jgi:hypothetical protein
VRTAQPQGDLYDSLIRPGPDASRTLIRFGATLQPELRTPSRGRKADMLDLIYLAAGVGVLALFALYAVTLRRI